MPPSAGVVLDGVEAVVEAVASRLEQAVPSELDLLEAAHGRPVAAPPLPEVDLWRPPGLYARSDRAIIGPDDYPAVLVVPQSTDAATLVEDMVDGAPVWRIPYRIRVWAFCRYFGADEVAACRNRLALAVLQGLLRAPRLADGMAFDVSGWRQSFSDVGVDDRDQSQVAGWWLEGVVTATESVTSTSVADANTVTLSVHPEAD